MIRFFFVFCLAQSSIVCAQLKPDQLSASPIVVTGNEMLYKTDENVSIVTGNARAEKGDGAEKQVLTADQFIVHFKDAKDKKLEASSGQDIETIHAIGNVVMIKGNDLVMKADQGTYSSEMAKDAKKADQIDCEGNVSVTKNGHLIKGDMGTVNLKTGIYTVKKTKGKRARAFIQMPSEKKV